MTRALLLAGLLAGVALTSPARAGDDEESAPRYLNEQPSEEMDRMDRERERQLRALRAQQGRLSREKREMQKQIASPEGLTRQPPGAQPPAQQTPPPTAAGKPRCVGGACP